MVGSSADAKATECPVCGTYYGTREQHYRKELEMVECGGEGKCPAREAGPRPTPGHVLCACNRSWLESSECSSGLHAYDDCH